MFISSSSCNLHFNASILVKKINTHTLTFVPISSKIAGTRVSAEWRKPSEKCTKKERIDVIHRTIDTSGDSRGEGVSLRIKNESHHKSVKCAVISPFWPEE